MQTRRLSKTQMGIYASSVNAVEGNYNMPLFHQLDDQVDITRLTDALDMVVAAHPTFFLRLATDADGDVVFEEHKDETFHTSIIDAETFDEVYAQVGRDFDFPHGRLFRIEIYQTKEGRYLYCDFHHVYLDGMTLINFFSEVSAVYSGGQPSKETKTIFDLNQEEEDICKTDVYTEAKQWNTDTFSAAADLNSLPQGDVVDDHCASSLTERAGGEAQPTVITHTFSIDQDKIANFCQQTDVKVSVLFTAAFGVLLSKLTGNKEVLFSTIWHGRQAREDRDAYAMMVKTLPVYVNLNNATTPGQLCQIVDQQQSGARKRTCYSYAEICAQLGVSIPVLFSYQGTLNNFDLVLDGRLQKDLHFLPHRPGIALNVKVLKTDGQFLVSFEYSKQKYTREFIEDMCLSYEKVIDEMLTQAQLKDISIVSESQQKLLDTFHTTATAEVPFRRFHEPIDYWAEKTPGAKAIIACDRTLTYKELKEETDRIAEDLKSRGLQPGDRVILLMPRTSEVICAMFGVSKAGGAYIPCDPAYPEERINLILEDSGARFIMRGTEAPPEAPPKSSPLGRTLKETSPNGGGREGAAPLAYLIYTSGSTGKPKGVMLRHEGICNYLYNHPENRHIHALVESGVKAYMCITTLSFDMSLKEFGVALHNGLTCVLANEEETENPILLAELMKRTGAEALNATPSRLLGYMEIPEFEEAMSRCKVVMSGGEKYSPVLLDKLHSIKGLRIFNTYGPTEITVSSNAAELTNTSHITIGQPLLNYHEWVVDGDGHELPVGVVGELYIGGVGVAAGYNNLPEKTEAAFIDFKGQRVYKSGDYARWTRDGKIEVLGRLDGQIKLHGLRIEIGEIESCINQYEGIKQSLVKVCKIKDDEYLVAYFTADRQIDADNLKAEISKTLTHYMVPSAFVQLDAFPLTPNGKTDVKNLPVPEIGEASLQLKVESGKLKADSLEGAPSFNILEEKIYDIIAGVLKMPSLLEIEKPQFDRETPLSALGLSSLSAIKLATLIYKRYKIQLKPQELVKSGTLASIENEVLTELMSPLPASPKSSPKGKDLQAPFPSVEGWASSLTYPQMGVYIDCVKNPDTTMYNIPKMVTFPDSVTAERLADAIKATVDNHQSFRLIFHSEKGEPRQMVKPDMKVEIPVKELNEAELEEYCKAFVRPFDLENGPLFRFEIVKSSKLHLLLDIHHLVTDGASLDIVLKEITARLDGTEIATEDLSYLQFAAEQQESENGDEYRLAKDYFHQRLSMCEGASEITPDLHNNDTAAHTMGTYLHPVDFSSVQQMAQKLGVTPMSVFLAATYYTVCRYVNNKQVFIATISNGRGNLKTYNTTGMFVNTLALSSEIKEQTVEEFIKETAEDFIKTVSHEQYPFAKISADYNYLPEIVFEYQVGVLESYKVNDEELKLCNLTLDTAKFKIKLAVISTEDAGCQVLINFDEAFYSPSLIERLAESYSAVISHFVSQVDSKVKKISIMSSAQAEIVRKMHTTATAKVPFHLFHEPIDYWAEKTPDAKAIIACDRTLTYKELKEETDRIAEDLKSRGMQPGDRVILLMPRTSEVICAMFGVSKAGGAYIPCDPAYPEERINLILEDSGARFIMKGASPKSSPEGKDLHTSPNGGGREGAAPLAYLIYTSGSTGKPKGVMLRHEGICNYLYNHPENRHIHALVESGVTAYMCITTLSFDMSLKEFGVALHNGLTCVLANEEEVNNPMLLAELFRKTGAQAINGTPSRLLNCMESDDFCKALSQCKVVMSGGEKYSDTLLERLQAMGVRIFNTYGPTEITVSSNAAELTNQKNISIGRPLLNYIEWIVDCDGNELPVGVVGELYIGGPGVAAGYNNLPEQTAAHFVDYQGQRVYKSGDYARWLPDGQVEILGRLDNQVKLNGLRIELGEVESVISKVEGMKQVVVMIRNIDGRDHLAAYFVAEKEIDIEEMKAEIGTTLTHYMVPTAYLQMDVFPLTPNGKVDLKHLPQPSLSQTSGNYVAPKNKVEEDFCHIFEHILNLEKVSATDSFFEIGGTSLNATRVLIEAVNYSYTISYADVFKYPTPQQLAEVASPKSSPKGKDLQAPFPSGEGWGEASGEASDSSINNLLANNTLESFKRGERQELGDVILTGANGYLGIHILHDLLENYLVEHPEHKVYCLVRHGKNGISSEKRLTNLLFYYFEKSYKDMLGKQLIIIDGDVTNPLDDTLAPYIPSLNSQQSALNATVINCAAIVKHFSQGTEIEDINVGGLQNCVDFCLKTGARLIQTSTGSTAGQSVDGNPPVTTVLTEQTSNIGQELRSKYAKSKYIAERIVFKAIIEQGLVGKVIRLGNLAPRVTDGEFQINFRTNSSMGRLHVYQMLGCMGYSAAENTMEFSPIDETAHAVLLLSQAPKECCVFHPVNNHLVLLGDVVREMGKVLHIDIEEVEDDEFQRRLMLAGQDPEKAQVLQSMLAYSNTREKLVYLKSVNRYTNNILSRMGFHWNVTSWDYVQRFIKAISALDFFEDKR